MGGFKIENESKNVSLKDFIVWGISDWIDSLSFFEDSDDWYNLEGYKETYKVFDSVLRDEKHCKAVFAEYGYNENEVVVLIVNNDAKYFIKIYGELNYNNDAISFEKVEFSYLEKQANRLQNLGYQEWKYCDWGEE